MSNINYNLFENNSGSFLFKDVLEDYFFKNLEYDAYSSNPFSYFFLEILSTTFLIKILSFILFIVLMLISIAYYTLCDRKIMAAMQRRMGPNVVGIWGLLQPFADGLKLFIKEIIVPNKANKILFFMAPIISFSVSLLGWVVMPIPAVNTSFTNIYLSVLFTIGISSIGVYGTLLSGWSSNSKYAFLGSLRSVAQTISYEVSLSVLVLSVCIFSKSLNYISIIEYQNIFGYNFLPLLPVSIMFAITILAETNRIPFDLPEAEAELVAGYNIEYSGLSFALFFLAEYSNMLIMSTLLIILFLGGWLPLFDGLSLTPLYLWFLNAFDCFLYDFRLYTMILKEQEMYFFFRDIPLTIFDDLILYYIPIALPLSLHKINAFILMFLCQIILKVLYTIILVTNTIMSIIPLFVWFALKMMFLIFFFVWVRASFPRYRYDQLMKLGWKVHLPFSLFFLYFYLLSFYLYI